MTTLRRTAPRRAARFSVANALTVLRLALIIGALALLAGTQGPLLAAEPPALVAALTGAVALVRSDGTALQPVPVGAPIGPGDRLATVGRATATVSLPGVGQFELGADTTVIVRALGAADGGPTIVEVVRGMTVHRLVANGTGGGYRVVDPPGAAAVDTRGPASFGAARDDDGNLTVGCERCPDGALTFPSPRHGLATGWSRTLSARGDLVTERLGGGLFDALARGSAADDPGSATPDGKRLPPGQRTGSRDRRPNLNDNDDPPTAPLIVAPLPTVQATIASFVFLPDPIVVKAGQPIRWINLDFAEHTVTADNHAFTSPVLNRDDTWTLTLMTPGTYGYFCEPHPQMTATIVVQ